MFLLEFEFSLSQLPPMQEAFPSLDKKKKKKSINLHIVINVIHLLNLLEQFHWYCFSDLFPSIMLVQY